ncbi:hypothetical protein GA0061078_0643 [Bifidobacterium bohemicum]|uniref:Uncharacterized protein n=1 Tax=Bifidobacterium bohemicum DSM 22767 TaxID=1437606 RepID=A0A086ZK39_9BIFI|nr:hypothetical protein [Bifidobacterium bohemicum]KFI46889.1 hypothetical protein BBOH_0363 [Bifidobacterium bohemicum DSM 22767]SCB84124.1 hypothetical protein GA0061078_0643 [Bifidobacterium bohemicum]
MFAMTAVYQGNDREGWLVMTLMAAVPAMTVYGWSDRHNGGMNRTMESYNE